MNDDLEIKCAEITLSAIESIIMDGREPLGYIFLPRDRSTERGEIIRRLAEESKPVLCFGLAIQGCLALACWLKSAKAWGEAGIVGVNQETLGSTAMVFIRSTLVVPMKTVQTWYRNHHLPQVGFSILEADDDARRAGATYQISFEKTENDLTTVGWIRPEP